MNWVGSFLITTIFMLASTGCSININPTVLGSGTTNETTSAAQNSTTYNLTLALKEAKVRESNYQAFQISGDCDPEGSTIDVTGDRFSTFTVNCNSAGKWTGAIVFPSNSSPGNETIQVKQFDQDDNLRQAHVETDVDLDCINFKAQSLPFQFGAGRGSLASPYIICHPSHINDLNDTVNFPNSEFIGKFFSLKNYIQYGSGDGALITRTFQSTFIGNDLEIRSPQLLLQSTGEVGFFKKLDGNGIVKNLNFSNALTTMSGSFSNIGIVAGTLDGNSKIERVTVNGSIDAMGSSVVGGLVGEVSENAEVRFSSVSISIVNGNNTIGGLVGMNKGKILNSWSGGSITASNKLGGIAGTSITGVSGAATINDCSSTMSIISTDSGMSLFGGITAQSQGPMTRVAFTGSISVAADSGNVGGISGQHAFYSVDSMQFSGSITGGNVRVGGLFGNVFDVPGQITGPLKVTKSSNRGEITASGAVDVGGLAGTASATSTDDIEFEECFAMSDITAGNLLGGLVGSTENVRIIDSFFANGNLNGDDEVGGIVGDATGNLTLTNIFSSPFSIAGSAKDLISPDVASASVVITKVIFNTSIGGSTVSGTMGLTDAQMQDQNNYEPQFDFTPTTGRWKWDSAISRYPVLQSF